MPVLKLGAKYKSAVCDTQIMAIRTVPDQLDLRCGGVPMIEGAATAPEGVAIDNAFSDGTLIGKRYIDGADRIELLCTKGGKGSLSLGQTRLEVKQAKALPSSD
jgi:hypothetical protein